MLDRENKLFPEHRIENKTGLISLWTILLANGLFAFLTNLLFFKIPSQSFSSSFSTPLLLGVVVYFVQISLIYILVKRYFSTDWIGQPFKAKNWYWAVFIGLALWLVANAVLALRLLENTMRLNSFKSFSRFFLVYLFNSLPGALIEEYLFRYLPVRFAESNGFTRFKTLILFLAVLIFFTATHIPAYLWQYKIPLGSLWSPFAMGAAFFFVYYATRNLPFTALFHAFTNQSWVLFGPAEIKDYSLIIIVSIFWYLLRINRFLQRT